MQQKSATHQRGVESGRLRGAAAVGEVVGVVRSRRSRRRRSSRVRRGGAAAAAAVHAERRGPQLGPGAGAGGQQAALVRGAAAEGGGGGGRRCCCLGAVHRAVRHRPGGNGKLREENIRWMDGIGVTWSVDLDHLW